MKGIKVVRGIVFAIFMIVMVMIIACTLMQWDVIPIMNGTSYSEGTLLINDSAGANRFSIPFLGYVVYYGWSLPGKIAIGIIFALLICSFMIKDPDEEKNTKVKNEDKNEMEKTLMENTVRSVVNTEETKEDNQLDLKNIEMSKMPENVNMADLSAELDQILTADGSETTMVPEIILEDMSPAESTVKIDLKEEGEILEINSIPEIVELKPDDSKTELSSIKDIPKDNVTAQDPDEYQIVFGNEMEMPAVIAPIELTTVDSEISCEDSALDEDKAALLNKIEVLKAEKAGVMSEIENLKSLKAYEISELERELKKEKDARSEIQTALETAIKDKAAIETSKIFLESSIEDLNMKLEQAKKDAVTNDESVVNLKDLEEKLRILTEENAISKDEYRSTAQKLEEAVHLVNVLQSDVRTLSGENDKIKESSSELLKEKKLIEYSLSKVKDELTVKNNELKKTSRELAEAKEIAAQASQMKIKVATLSEEKKKTELALAEALHLVEKNSIDEKERNAEKEALNNIYIKLQEANNVISEQNNQIEQLRYEKRNVEEKANTLVAEVNTITKAYEKEKTRATELESLAQRTISFSENELNLRQQTEDNTYVLRADYRLLYERYLKVFEILVKMNVTSREAYEREKARFSERKLVQMPQEQSPVLTVR